MNPILRNTLAVIVGIIIGSIVNMSIILMSSSIIPPPNGVDNSTMEGLQKTMHLFEAEHFLFPFLAHAVGTFAGAVTTAILAFNQKKKLALVIGAFFLLSGIVSVCSLPSPRWFTFIDLAFAYIPMSYLALRTVCKKETRLQY
ncbi:uncharacterized membrane protein HdeD (DUF308 family) [Flavobacterium sp. HSC-32F16]|uniref:hypothetical protein n=1 Tax=Flavobacterium sp. HSC-32F16 TaxID=2910964 RepID=UPI0020A2FAC1|nr:hypothetical protein [Flavobacterium sp. HSC-32F16]MCP2028944.1 uncharacterized membrane protein HdeD (DUF308 family) [Flavobacterium sp. HSC-32F16]